MASPPNKKTVLWWAALSRPNKISQPSKPVLSLEGFLCVGQIQPRCLLEAAAIYIVSRTSEDNLLKKALLARGTFLLSKSKSHIYIIEIIMRIAVEVLVPLRLFVCRKMS